MSAGLLFLSRPRGRSARLAMAVLAAGTAVATVCSGGSRAWAGSVPAGSPDPNFGTNGVASDPATGDAIAAGALVDSTGGLVTAGTSRQGGQSVVVLARFSSTGKLDPSFGQSGTSAGGLPGAPNASASAVALVPAGPMGAGDIVVAGSSTTSAGGSEMVIARYTSSGVLDSSFGSSGVVTTAAGSGAGEDDGFDAVAVQPDGSVVAAGFSRGGNALEPSDLALVVARYSSAGQLDMSFGQGGIATADLGASVNPAAGVIIASDGSIFVSGSGEDPSSGQSDVTLVRFTGAGALDKSFGQSGIVHTPAPAGGSAHGGGEALEPDGSVLVAAGFAGGTTSQAVVIRYAPSGTLDSSFAKSGILATGVGSNSVANAVAVESADGKIIFAGSAKSSSGSQSVLVGRITSSGAMDSSFGYLGSGLSATDPGSGFAGAASVALVPSNAAGADIVVAGPQLAGSTTGLALEGLVGQPTGGGNGATGTGPTPTGGYWMVASDGGIFNYGTATFEGAGAGRFPAAAVGMARTPDGGGYWEVTSAGGVANFGDATNFGGVVFGRVSNVIGMAAAPDGEGYWLVSSSGGIFTYGDAGFFGSAGNLHLAKPMVGLAATPDGKGYWLVASDGGIFTYGDAGFFGSAGAIHLNRPIVGMAATPDGKGYWMVASDGGIFTYGDAGFFGSAGANHLNRPIVGMAATPDGKGYWMVASDGGIFTYGDAGFFGSAGSIRLARPIVGMAGQ